VRLVLDETGNSLILAFTNPRGQWVAPRAGHGHDGDCERLTQEECGPLRPGPHAPVSSRIQDVLGVVWGLSGISPILAGQEVVRLRTACCHWPPGNDEFSPYWVVEILGCVTVSRNDDYSTGRVTLVLDRDHAVTHTNFIQ
jgi:hypothetical protein